LASLAQDNRFEYKYVIEEQTARSARDFVRMYLKPDRYADPRRDNSYRVHSLYLDSPDLALCRATVHGHKNRFKLRLRFYDEDPDHPVFFEIKRRVNDVIIKARAAVRRTSILPLLAGHSPTMRDLMKPDARGLASLGRFCDLRRIVGADGHAYVSYEREAYASPDERVRVTCDRRIRSAPYHHVFKLPAPDEWAYPPVPGVVLELKFTERFPTWMGDMVHALNLQRGPMAKYVACIGSEPSLQSVLAYEF
jgi:hypothetical protein